jgi:hypothetical protein
MGYQARHLYRPRRFELERKSFKLTLKTVILKPESALCAKIPKMPKIVASLRAVFIHF